MCCCVASLFARSPPCHGLKLRVYTVRVIDAVCMFYEMGWATPGPWMTTMVPISEKKEAKR